MPRLLIVGNADEVHVGAHFRHAALSLGLETEFCDTDAAFAAPRWLRVASWRLLGHRPVRLREFSAHVVDTARRFRPDLVLTTGIAPLEADALRDLGALGIARVNYLTDDPWNPGQRAPWFMTALAGYDHVFTPRRANLADLAAAGVRATFVPFAYSPQVHFPEAPSTVDEQTRYDADIVFAGGADRDRVSIAAALIQAGYKVALYGGYWDRDLRTRAAARGFLDAAGVRKAIAAARVCLCLVRRANRDGNSMRTFEVPAMRGCMLMETTDDHRRLFGDDHSAVSYFATASEAVTKAAMLLGGAKTRETLARRAFEIVTAGGHTYADRLQTMLSTTMNWRPARG
jgi:hypothetical protein